MGDKINDNITMGGEEVISTLKTGGPLNDRKNLPTVEDYESLNRKIIDLRDDLKQEKASTLVIFGIFASIIAFLSVNVQVFQTIKSPLSIFGINLFILGGLALFLLLLIELSKGINSEKFDTKNINLFSTQIFQIILTCLVLGSLLVCADNLHIFKEYRNDGILIKVEQ